MHTLSAPFSEYSQIYPIWIGHISAIALFYVLFKLRSISSLIFVPMLCGLAWVAYLVDEARDRPGDRELEEIAATIGAGAYTITVDFPDGPGQVELTLYSDGNALTLDSLSAGNRCSYEVQASGVEGSDVSLELDVAEGECRKLTGKAVQTDKYIDFDLYSNGNRNLPIQFRFNLPDGQ